MTADQMNMETATPGLKLHQEVSVCHVREYIHKVITMLDRGVAFDQGATYSFDYNLDDFDISGDSSTILALSGDGHADSRFLRARAHLARTVGDLEAGEIWLRQALENTAEDAGLTHELILNLKDQERLGDAEELCAYALEKNPLSTTLHLDMAAVLAEQARLDAAADHALAATKLSPGSAVVWLVLGNLLFLLRRFDSAGQAFRKCAGIAPADPVGYFMLGRSLSLECRDDEAVDAYREACRLVKASEGALSAAACHVRKRFTGDTAIRDCSPFCNSHEQPLEYVLRCLADAQIKAGRLEEAEQTAIELTRHAELTAISAPGHIPRDDMAFYLLGVALFLQGKYGSAIPPFKRAAALRNKDVRLSFLLASCLWHMGDHEGAVQACLRSMVWFAPSVPRPGALNRADMGEQAETRVTLPWNMRMYQNSGMFHPLINEVTQERYTGFSLEYPVPRYHLGELRDSCLRVLEHFSASRDWLATVCPDVSPGQIFAFLESRHFLSQVLADNPNHQFSIMHTAPYTLNQTPWLLHLEVPITVFFPFISYGISWNLEFESKPYYKLAKAYVESPQCLGIFSHLKSTCEALPRLFRNQKLAEKIHYFPLSAPALKASQAQKPSENGGPIRILFTGSFNHDPWSFYSRGGLYVVEAFLALVEEYPDLELVLRVELPLTLDQKLLDRILGHPRISIMIQWLSEQELQGLFDSADIMALPSYTLHCQSIFRAMASGCCCVVSDAPDFEQFVRDGENCLIAGGRRGRVYDVDPELGIVREHYPNMRIFEPSYAKTVTATFRRLLADRGLLRKLQTNAREFIAAEYPQEKTVAAFNRLLEVSRTRLPSQ